MRCSLKTLYMLSIINMVLITTGISLTIFSIQTNEQHRESDHIQSLIYLNKTFNSILQNQKTFLHKLHLGGIG